MNNKVLKLTIYLTAFILGASLLLGAGYYKKSLYNETKSFNVDLKYEKDKQQSSAVSFDIQDEGIPKKLVQPGRISISAAKITNKGREPITLKVQLYGFKGQTGLSSKDTSFNASTASFEKPIPSNESTNLSLTLNIPRSEFNKKYDVSEGKVAFLNSKSGEVLAVVPINIVNSALKQ